MNALPFRKGDVASAATGDRYSQNWDSDSVRGSVDLASRARGAVFASVWKSRVLDSGVGSGTLLLKWEMGTSFWSWKLDSVSGGGSRDVSAGGLTQNCSVWRKEGLSCLTWRAPLVSERSRKFWDEGASELVWAYEVYKVLTKLPRFVWTSGFELDFT